MPIFWSFFDDSTIFDKITKFTKTLPCFRNDILKITDLEISVILSVFDHFLIIFDDFVSFVKITKFTKTLPCFRNDILKITDLEILVIFVSFWSFLVGFSRFWQNRKNSIASEIDLLFKHQNSKNHRFRDFGHFR